MSGIHNLAKKYFYLGIHEWNAKVHIVIWRIHLMIGPDPPQFILYVAQFKIVQNFHYFCKVRGCRISVKNLILAKIASNFVETFPLMSTKEFSKTKFVCKVRATFQISVKNLIYHPKNDSNFVKTFSSNFLVGFKAQWIIFDEYSIKNQVSNKTAIVR